MRRGESVGFAVADSNRLLKSTAGVSVDLNDLKLRKAILRLVCDGKARDEQLQFSCGGDEPTEIVPVPANSSAWLNSVALGEKIVFLEGEVSRYKSASQQVERQLSVEKDKLDKCHGERDEAISRAEWSVKRLQSMEIAMRSWEPPKNHPVVCIRYRDSDDRDLAEGLAAGFKGEGAAWVVSVEDSTIGKNPRQETRVVLFSNRTDSGALVHCLKWFLPGDGQDAAERKLTAWPSREGQEADVEIQVFDHVWKP